MSGIENLGEGRENINAPRTSIANEIMRGNEL